MRGATSGLRARGTVMSMRCRGARWSPHGRRDCFDANHGEAEHSVEQRSAALSARRRHPAARWVAPCTGLPRWTRPRRFAGRMSHAALLTTFAVSSPECRDHPNLAAKVVLLLGFCMAC